LSEKGKKQAKKLLLHFLESYPDSVPLILSSPKARCKETVEPISVRVKVPVKESDLLDEGDYVERRAESFIKWWKEKGPELTIACSHGDWIPVGLEKATGVSVDLEKGGWAELREKKGKIELITLIQEP